MFAIHYRSLLALVLAAALASCASLPTDYPRESSEAFQDHQDTLIGGRVAKGAAQHPGKSGFALLRHGRPAFTGRIAFTALAEKTLDVQYYIWEDDATGHILAQRLLEAADRGIRVRVLLDDINLKGRDDHIAALDAHPNIEIRLFNPFAHRSARALDFIVDFGRVNHRMHNKLIVMDNAFAIVGGRNIGNHYFQVDEHANFRDLDIVAAGPVVREISSVFDHFFNGEWSIPIAALVDKPQTAQDLQEARSAQAKMIASENYPHPLDQDVAELSVEITDMVDKLIWAPGRVIWDDPKSIQETGSTSRMQEALHKRVARLEEELLIESAYFVVRDRALDALRTLSERGVRVRILTNSLISNDVLAAHAGYAERRKELVANGAEVYELREDADAVNQRVIAGTSKAALHTKAIVFDRHDIFIGSFNLDPRSGDINTEAGLYVESPELARQLMVFMEEGVTPQSSYRVTLDESGDLMWTAEEGGEVITFHKDPGSTWWQRFQSGFIEILPVEDQL